MSTVRGGRRNETGEEVDVWTSGERSEGLRPSGGQVEHDSDCKAMWGGASARRGVKMSLKGR